MMPRFLAATADDVFRSVGQNMDDSVDSRGLITLGAIVLGVVLILVIASRRREKKVAPTTINNAGRLVKEMQKKVGLRPSELRQLRAMAEQQELENPLVLMLCPSVLKRASDAGKRAKKAARARGA